MSACLDSLLDRERLADIATNDALLGLTRWEERIVPAEFRIAGKVYTREAMLRANADDPDFCVWATRAAPGDVYEQMHAERCECVEQRQ